MDSKIEILDLSYSFGLMIIKYCEAIEKNKKFLIAWELQKLGTSIGIGIRDAENAENRQEFVNKLKAVLKVSEETEYLLLLCNESKNYPSTEELIESIKKISNLLKTIISKTKKVLINKI